MFEVSIEELKKVFADFYNLTKFKIVLWNSDKQILYSYPDTMCDFCKTVRSSKPLLEKCLQCDNVGFDICDATRQPYVYECHMSVIEAIAPIYSNEINIGYLMFGQILGEDKEKVRKKAKEISATFNISITSDMINEMTSASESYIRSAVNMMSMCANYLYTNEIIRNIPNVFSYHLKSYIDTHLNSKLDVKKLCKHFYISQTKLYKISKECFGMGISDYIRLERIKKAKTLLLKTDLPVFQIAADVGIDDTNYFIRIFKQHEGITPLQFKNKHNFNDSQL